MASEGKDELRPTTAEDTEATASGGDDKSEEEIGKPPKEPGIYITVLILIAVLLFIFVSTWCLCCRTVAKAPAVGHLNVSFPLIRQITNARFSKSRFRLPRQLRQRSRR